MEKPLRVIVADALRTSAEDIAQAIGRTDPACCVVGIAQGGADVLRQVERLQPEVVVLGAGLQSPGNSAVFSGIRAICPEVRLLLICANADPPPEPTAMPEQGTDYLYLPLNQLDLLGKLRSLASGLNQSRKETAAETPNEPTAIVAKVQAYVKECYHQKINFSLVAQQHRISAADLTRLFLERTGLSPREYLTRYRIARAKHLLTGTKLSVMEVGARVGYRDPSHFSNVFRQYEHVNPTEYRKHTPNIP